MPQPQSNSRDVLEVQTVRVSVDFEMHSVFERDSPLSAPVPDLLHDFAVYPLYPIELRDFELSELSEGFSEQ